MTHRIIARMDIKQSHLIKGIQMEGWRKIGDPVAYANKYYNEHADEIFCVDVVASLYQRNNLLKIIQKIAGQCFIPMTVGGGIDSVDSASMLLTSGADKVALNTAATKNPDLLNQISSRFGQQALVLNLESKKTAPGKWTVLTDNGRNRTGLDAIEWAAEAVTRGVGEIMINSIDRDGTNQGPDLDLIRAISSVVSVPIVYAGGISRCEHALDALSMGINAVAIGTGLHYEHMKILELKNYLAQANLSVRPQPILATL